MKKNFVLLFISLISFAVQSQHYVYQNFDLKNSERIEIVNLLNDYLNSELSPEEVFTTFDLKNYNSIDIMKESLSLSGSLYSITFNANILSIKNEGENYIAQALLYWHNNESKNQTITVLGIVNFWFKKESGKWKISNYLNYHTLDWSKTKVGNITFIYYPKYPFNKIEADRAVNFYKKLHETFEIKDGDDLTYFITENCNEVYQISGFEYFISEGNDSNACGFYDGTNNFIYTTSSWGETHFHEIIHTINNYFPTANEYLLIGLSCYINDAGSKGKDILFHIKKFKEYSKTHAIDFENFENLQNIDEYTNISYVTGTLLCNAIYRKGGKKLLLEFLKDTEDISEFKDKFKKEFKINNFETFFKAEIELFLKQKKSLFYIE